MKRHRQALFRPLRALAAGIGFFGWLTLLPAWAEPPTVRLVSASQPRLSVALSVRPFTNGWVSIEATTNLQVWLPLAQLLTTNASGPYVDEATSNTVAKFYRVVRPGVSPGEMQTAWNTHRPDHFRYQFQNFALDAGGDWQATVTVSNGLKLVSGVTLNGFPTNNFNASLFLSPDELFASLLAAEADGVKLAHASYDPEWRLPQAVTIIRGGTEPIRQYRCFQFEALAAPASDAEPGRSVTAAAP